MKLIESDSLFQVLIQLNEKPLRSKRPTDLVKFSPPPSPQLRPRSYSFDRECEICGALNDFVECVSSGDTVCFQCGSVCKTPLYQELAPFMWKSVRVSDYLSSSLSDSSPESPSGTPRLSGRTYFRVFHFNEILAAFNLQGPPIPNTDMRLIREELEKEPQPIKPTDKTAIQRIFRQLNKKGRVKRFSQRYGEKWIQVSYRAMKARPPGISKELKKRIQGTFRAIESTWPRVKHLLKGSQKDKDREQFPNFTVTLYEILRREFPWLWEEYKEWLPLLSEKKLQELKPCFDGMFYYIGSKVY